MRRSVLPCLRRKYGGSICVVSHQWVCPWSKSLRQLDHQAPARGLLPRQNGQPRNARQQLRQSARLWLSVAGTFLHGQFIIHSCSGNVWIYLRMIPPCSNPGVIGLVSCFASAPSIFPNLNQQKVTKNKENFKRTKQIRAYKGIGINVVMKSCTLLHVNVTLNDNNTKILII